MSPTVIMFGRIAQIIAIDSSKNCRIGDSKDSIAINYDNSKANRKSKIDNNDSITQEQHNHNDDLLAIFSPLRMPMIFGNFPPRFKTLYKTTLTEITIETATRASLTIALTTATLSTLLSKTFITPLLLEAKKLEATISIDDIHYSSSNCSKMISITSSKNNNQHSNESNNNDYKNRDRNGGEEDDDDDDNVNVAYNFCALTYAPSNRQRTRNNTAKYVDNGRRPPRRSNTSRNNINYSINCPDKNSSDENALGHVFNMKMLSLLRLPMLKRWKCRIYTSLLIMLLLILTIHFDTISADQGNMIYILIAIKLYCTNSGILYLYM